MRRVIVIFLLALLGSYTSIEAKDSIDKLYGELSSYPDAVHLNMNQFSSWLVKAFSGSGDGVLDNMKSSRIVAIDSCKGETLARLNSLFDNVSADGYEKLMEVNQPGDRVVIYAKPKGKKLSRVIIMALSDGDFAYMEFKGSFTPDIIDKLLDS